MRRLFIILGLLFSLSFAFGQEKNSKNKSVVQFSGVVIEDDTVNTYPIPGIAVYVPGTGRGSITNMKGFFTMPVLPGDSIVIKGLGYVVQHRKISDSLAGNLSMKIRLVPDTLELPDFRLPYATEQEFKQAFLALELPEDERKDYARQNLNPSTLLSMQLNAEATSSMNFRHVMQSNIAHHEKKYSMTTIPFLDPFRWIQLIDYLTNKKKRDKEREIRRKLEEEAANKD